MLTSEPAELVRQRRAKANVRRARYALLRAADACLLAESPQEAKDLRGDLDFAVSQWLRARILEATKC
jgi:hypothetical protein